MLSIKRRQFFCSNLAFIKTFSVILISKVIFAGFAKKLEEFLCEITVKIRQKTAFRLPAVLSFGSDSNGSGFSKKEPVPVPFWFLKMTSEPSVPRFRLEPTQLYSIR